MLNTNPVDRIQTVVREDYRDWHPYSDELVDRARVIDAIRTLDRGAFDRAFQDLQICHTALLKNHIRLDAWVEAPGVGQVKVGHLRAAMASKKYLRVEWCNAITNLERVLGERLRAIVVQHAYVEGYAQRRGIGTALYLEAICRAREIRGVLVPGRATRSNATSNLAKALWWRLGEQVGTYGCLVWSDV